MINMHKHTHTRVRAASSGFTLLEVLIAIVVVAFGLLGLAGLQLFALKNNQSASARVAATSLASDMIDRMKANFQGVIAGNYHAPDLTSYGGPAVPTCNTVAGCTPAELAQHDLLEWTTRVAAALPGGVGIVCSDPTPNDAAPTPTPPALTGCAPAATSDLPLYAVKIWWVDDRSQANPGGTLKYVYTAFNP